MKNLIWLIFGLILFTSCEKEPTTKEVKVIVTGPADAYMFVKYGVGTDLNSFTYTDSFLDSASVFRKTFILGRGEIVYVYATVLNRRYSDWVEINGFYDYQPHVVRAEHQFAETQTGYIPIPN